MRAELVPRKRVSEPLVDQPIEVRHGQRPEAETIRRDPDVDHSDSGVEGRRDADGGEETGAQRSESPNRERDHPKGRYVEPLQVVDRDDDRRFPRHPDEQRMEAGRGGNAANRLAGLRFDARQGDLQRATLRTRELAEQVEVLAEQVEQTGEGELGLGLDRLRGEDRVTARQRTCANLRPDRRLADPGLALEHERRRAAVERVKEPVAGGKIVVATDHPRPAIPDRRHVILGRPWVRSDRSDRSGGR